MADIVYKINLNKASNRLDQFEQKQKTKKVAALGFYFIVVALIVGLAVFESMKTQAVIDDYTAELENIEKEIAELKTSTDYLSPEDIFALAELATTRLTWTEKFNVLGLILPDDVAITELSYDYSMNALSIKGISKVKYGTKDLDLVVSILDVIKNNEDFAKDFVDIKFSSSTRVKYHGQEIVEFEIACLVG
ncbi:MAG: hypothetical protein J7K40_00660 [candidate division Zixibacteria bacterium]|nr:hypothetical protein [candidate division Zixibacteria bacterium]